jgi:MSHA pilin protein MshC|tara:strand:+ start:503 stop:1036 length:534 start_codon:yes stop_codon:yes gene_type:complete
MTIGQYKQSAGFSLIELITVIVLLGILSVFAVSRLMSPDQFAVKVFFNDTVNAVRFAQKLAVGTGCDVQVKMSVAGYQLLRSSAISTNPGISACTANNFDVLVNNPVNRSKDYENLGTGFKVSMVPASDPLTSMIFNARGVLDSGDNVTYTVSDGITGSSSSFNFTVFGQTGLVNVP